MNSLSEKLKEYLVNPPISEDDLDREIIFFSEYDSWEKTVFENLGKYRNKVVGVCKNTPSAPVDFLGSNYFRRVNAVSPDFVIEKCKDAILLVTVNDKDLNDKIKDEFKEYGHPFVTDMSGYTFSQACAGHILPKKEMNALAEAYDFFTDEASRKVILDKALYVIGEARNTPFETPQYFLPCLDLSENEIVADCGFYTGDTAEEHLKLIGSFEKYYGFEPSEANLAKVSPEIANDPRIEIIKSGVYSYNTVLHFEQKGEGYASSSSFNESGSESLPVVSLDAFFEDKEKPTFIKMDIEGSEIAALLGAKFIIRENKPKLAVCVYHKPDDIIEIPKLIKELNPDYEMELHCHTNIGADIVVYCY
ncbi:MAG: FkbM family methyltransferase [Ruminococcus sp.]|nr:FkbM family methyltransferase [Ruminococcus sp.]